MLLLHKLLSELFLIVTTLLLSDAKSGQSTVTLDITSAAETKMFRVVGSANEIGNDDMSAAAGVNVRVAWNSASNLYQ